MELLYKVEGTIFYKDSAEEVENFIEVLRETEKVHAKLITKTEEQETCKFGIQFSFYKKAKDGFVSDFLVLLRSGKRLDSGEIFFADSYGEQRLIVSYGRFLYNRF